MHALKMGRYVPLFALAAIMIAVSVANADTIYLKNGSVIKGKVTSFSEDQFSVLLSAGSSSRAQIYIGDVARIEFDSAGAVADSGPAQPPPSDTPPVRADRNTGADRNVPHDDGGGGAVAGSENPPAGSAANPPGSDRPSGGGDNQRSIPPTDASGTPQPNSDNTAQPGQPTQPSQPSDSADSTPPLRSKGPIKTANVDVIAKRDWTSSGLIVKRGDRIRVRASGTVTLDPNAGTTSGPEGIDQQDPKKLMQDKPTGCLIAVIGADNDDFIFIGRQNEFTAARDGLLFLSVNEGTLSDNSGSFKAVIEVASAH